MSVMGDGKYFNESDCSDAVRIGSRVFLALTDENVDSEMNSV